MFAHGAKARRISYSTSHSETLAAISGLETASLVALRLAELLVPTEKPTLYSNLQHFKKLEFPPRLVAVLYLKIDPNELTSWPIEKPDFVDAYVG